MLHALHLPERPLPGWTRTPFPKLLRIFSSVRPVSLHFLDEGFFFGLAWGSDDLSMPVEQCQTLVECFVILGEQMPITQEKA